jgi:ribonuclease P protein component
MKQYGFSKQERICKRDDFQIILTKGKSVYHYPFRCIYMWEDSSFFSAKIAVSVSRRRFKHAVDRNRIKRLVRESYRLNKHILYQYYADCNKSLNLLIIYTDTKIFPFSFIEKKFIGLTNKLIKENDKLDNDEKVNY